MKAIVCKSFGPPSSLTLEDIPTPVNGADEILISVKACCVNFPDTLIIQGKYQFKPEPPFTPGADVAGVVKSIGDNVKGFKVGDAVFGVVLHGGFAEEVVLSKTKLLPNTARYAI